MRRYTLSTLALTLVAQCQVTEQFNPPKANCCLQGAAQSLADQLQDWNQLGRHYADNQRLKAMPPDPGRVVFLGDSITDGWKLAQSFPDKPYVNRGIGGQTTPQMLVRVFPDVIDLKPAAVIVLAGTNDIAGNTGAVTLTMIEENLQAITELAQAHGIKVILCTVMPVSDYTPRRQTPRRPPSDILKLNEWIRDYASRVNAVLADYYAAIVDEKGMLREGYSEDGLHPNPKGYSLLAPVADAAIQKALVQFPQVEISSSSLHAKLYLPDARNGYYQGTRFDWSGVISSLVFDRHEYFGKWFDRYDPKIHDAITGPVEEFLTNGTALGYAEARPGESFVKIGVGALRKPNEPAYRRFDTYEILDSGKWTVNKGPDWIEFVQELTDASGYAYLYRKTMRLAKNKPELVLEHSLKNTGRKTIETSVYEHNFFMLDGQPTAPDVIVKFPFALRSKADLGGLAEIHGKDLVFLREFEKGQTVMTELEGYGASTADNDVRVENRKTGAGVRQTGDRPLSKMLLWSIRTTVCPEAYISMRIEPGQESTWRISYEFYTLRQ